PLALIALPLQSGKPGAGLSRRAIVALELATLGLFALAHWLIVPAMPGLWLRAQPWLEPRLSAWLWGGHGIDHQAVFVPLVGAAAGLAAIFSMRVVKSTRLGWMIFALGLAITCVAGPACLASAKQESGSAFYEETVNVHRFISKNIRQREVRFWYSCPP